MQNRPILEPLIVNSLQALKTIWRNITTYTLPESIPYKIDNQIHLPSENIYIPIGINILGKTQYLKIGGEQSHTYVVGQTGAGKSNITKVILSTIVNQYPTVKLFLLDYKRVELSLFSNTKNCINFQWQEESISQVLKDLYSLVLSRYDALAERGLTEADNTMNIILAIIEEVSLMPKNDMKILRKIMAISRAVKVYIIFTTQRPSNECLDNVVKSLVGNRISLKCDDKKNSLISLDVEGAETLRGKGHGYYKSAGEIYEFQSYFITDSLVKQVCDAHRKPYKPFTDVLSPPNDKQDVLVNEDWIDRL